jgi:6-pyruvoyltetrahydropterin/6-carboxytetrahydropterin synthase
MRHVVTTVIHFCYGHRLLDYQGKCRHLHGHNGRVEIELAAARLDRLGMVRDFTEIKRAIQSWIDAHLDHQMILCKDDPAVALLRRLKEPLYLLDVNPTAEHLARLVYEQATRLGLPVTAVHLWETESSCATYQPRASRRRSPSARRLR